MRNCSISYERGHGASLLEKGEYYMMFRSIIILFCSIIVPFSSWLGTGLSYVAVIGPGTGLSRVMVIAPMVMLQQGPVQD